MFEERSVLELASTGRSGNKTGKRLGRWQTIMRNNRGSHVSALWDPLHIEHTADDLQQGRSYAMRINMYIIREQHCDAQQIAHRNTKEQIAKRCSQRIVRIMAFFSWHAHRPVQITGIWKMSNCTQWSIQWIQRAIGHQFQQDHFRIPRRKRPLAIRHLRAQLCTRRSMTNGAREVTSVREIRRTPMKPRTLL